MVRVPVKPEMLQWACDRADVTVHELSARVPKLEEWLREELQPTLRQLHDFARRTHTPIGFLFLAEPPVERLPIPDFRTIRNDPTRHPSPDLLDTIYLCQQRQTWYHDHARAAGEDRHAFVGSVTTDADIVRAASTIRDALNFDLEDRGRHRTWEDALRAFKHHADQLGVLVMTSGIVGNNTHRRLDTDEFRGFAIADDLAPLIFINGTDTKSGQMFTLAHELAHIWLGQSALSDITPIVATDDQLERWCNQVAAELLVPIDDFRVRYRMDQQVDDEARRLARVYKVSTLVILRRMHDAGGLTREQLWHAYDAELARLRHLRPTSSGGDFYNTTISRTGERFAAALIASTLEGNTLFRDAYRLLGTSKRTVFDNLAELLGIG